MLVMREAHGIVSVTAGRFVGWHEQGGCGGAGGKGKPELMRVVQLK